MNSPHTRPEPGRVDPSAADERDRHSRRRPVLAFALATVALGGVGAAITTAAWTDDVFFSGHAGAAVFTLKGSLDGTTFTTSNDVNEINLSIPSDRLSNLLPGQTRTIDLWVTNAGSVNAALVGSASFRESTFATDPTVALTDLAATLTPVSTSGATDKFQLTLTTPLDWSVLNQTGSGHIVVTITGTATA